MNVQLECCGVTDNVLKWILSYCSSRFQSVKIYIYESYTYIAISGVPQGTNCGPSFFIICMNVFKLVMSLLTYLKSADDKCYMKNIQEKNSTLWLDNTPTRL